MLVSRSLYISPPRPAWRKYLNFFLKLLKTKKTVLHSLLRLKNIRRRKLTYVCK